MTATQDGSFGNAAEGYTKSQGSQRSTGRSFSEQSGRVVEEAQELGRVALAGASEVATNLREKGREVLHSGRERAMVARDKCSTAIAANPLKSVLIAAGVGAVLGFVLSRRSR